MYNAMLYMPSCFTAKTLTILQVERRYVNMIGALFIIMDNVRLKA